MMRGLRWLGFLALILLPNVGVADTGVNWAKKIHIGGRAGLDWATHAGKGANDGTVSSFYKLGLSAGGLVGIQLHERIVTQLELSFSTKGPNSTVDRLEGMDSATYHMSYLEIPLLATVTLPLPGRIKYYATMGPAISFMLNASIELSDGRNLGLDNSFKTVDIGLMLGAGAAVPVGQRGAVTFDIRYNLGLINIDKTAGPVDDDVMNRTVYFLVGYQTDLGFLSGAAPAASKSSLPVAEPPANDNEPTSPDAVPTSGEPEAGTESDPEESLLPE